MTELEKRVKKLEEQVDKFGKELDDLKNRGFMFNDSYFKKELGDLKNAFMSGDKKLDEKISELEKRVKKLES